MRLIAVIGFILAFSACKTTGPKLGDDTGIPGDSIATISPALSSDAKRNISEWLNVNYSCEQFTLLDTNKVKSEGKILMDSEGRLHSGTISEQWLIKACGIQRSIGMVFAPDGKGGNYISIVDFES